MSAAAVLAHDDTDRFGERARCLVSLDDALAALSEVTPAASVEDVRLEDADGRRLSAPVRARCASPPAAVAAMDGYAVRDADLKCAAPRLRIVGRAFAGAGYDHPLAPGECVRIFTGARVPRNADRVVMQEDVRLAGGFAIFGCVSGKSHIRAQGSDFKCGDVLAAAGMRLTPQALIAIAAGDIGTVSVVARPRVSIVCTGDELVEPGLARQGIDAIPESVSFGVAALAKRWGADVVSRIRVDDCIDALRRAADRALAESDIVVVIGGASVGERDHAKAMFAHTGLDIAVGKVAIRPGKPVWFGAARERAVIGLPGNPSAALVTARLFLAPLIAAAGGGVFSDALAWRKAALAINISAGDAREKLIKARCTPAGVAPLESQDSSAQGSLAQADVLIRRRCDAPEARAGDGVDVLDLS